MLAYQMRPVTPPSYDGGSIASDNEGDDNDLMETFIIMEYCEGGPLDKEIRQGRFKREEEGGPDMVSGSCFRA